MTDLRKAAERALEILETDQEKVHWQTVRALRKALSNEFNPDWNQVEALQESLREHMAEIQRLRQALAQPEPTVEDNSQNWKGMDGAVAWHLIDRHADNWADVGKMMDKWLKANQAQPEQEAFHRLLRIMGTFDLATGHADSWDELLDSLESELRDVLGHLRARREWDGLTDDETKQMCELWQIVSGGWVTKLAKDIEAKLKEKNCG